MTPLFYLMTMPSYGDKEMEKRRWRKGDGDGDK
jgi:hypothetical protein